MLLKASKGMCPQPLLSSAKHTGRTGWRNTRPRAQGMKVESSSNNTLWPGDADTNSCPVLPLCLGVIFRLSTNNSTTVTPSPDRQWT